MSDPAAAEPSDEDACVGSVDGVASPTGPQPRPGDRVAVWTAPDRPVTSAVVETCGDETWLVRLDAQPRTHDGVLFLRCVDEDGQAWGAEVELVRPTDSVLRLLLRRRGPWTRVGARGAVRVLAGEPVVGAQVHDAFGFRAPTPRSYRLQVLDVSSTGCRAGVAGVVPSVGVTLRLHAGGGLTRSLDARVVRVVPGPFGRTEIGLAFVLPGADERRVALAWRDALARVGR